MGLLEYQAMPSLRDVAHDGVLSVLSVIYQPQTGTSGVVRQGRRHGPSIRTKSHPLLCWVTLLQPAWRAAVLCQPSSLLPRWLTLPLMHTYFEGEEERGGGG
jgi:hypothetical protein